MKRSQAIRYGCVGAALTALAVMVTGCADDPRQRAALATPLTRGVTTPTLTIPLAPVPLATQADFDQLEDGFLDRRQAEELVELYTLLATDADPAQRPADALLLQRLAILLVDNRGVRGSVTQGLTVAADLKGAAPSSVHAQYLDGYIKRKLLHGAGGKRAMLVTVANRAAAEQVAEHWSALLAADPDYAGPQGHAAAEIAEDVARLRRALTQAPTAAPTAARETPVLAEAASEAALTAIGHLASFETTNDAGRKSLCRERRDAKLSGGDTLPERRVDLACAVFEARVDDALVGLEALIQAGANIDACGLVESLAAAKPKGFTPEQTQRLAALKLDGCPQGRAAQP